MKPGWGNGYFIADAHDARLTLDDIRARWKAGDYGKVRADYATQWLALAGRKVSNGTE
jgi:hypothetical protein